MPAGAESSGGSAANTCAVAAGLGARVAYLGKVADDRLGQAFRRDIAAAGVHFPTAPLSGGAATARCLILVTPDGQRTMNTFLGACVAFGEDDLDEAAIADASVLYLEGYLFDPPAAQAAFRRAAGRGARGRAAGGAVAFGRVLRGPPPGGVPRAGRRRAWTSCSPTRPRSAACTSSATFDDAAEAAGTRRGAGGADPQRAGQPDPVRSATRRGAGRGGRGGGHDRGGRCLRGRLPGRATRPATRWRPAGGWAASPRRR